MKYAQILNRLKASAEDLASEAKWLRRSWAGVHVLGEILNGMLLGNPARGRPMFFASDELTAALMFQRKR